MKLRHWEYSFVLHTCRLGDRVRKGTNPFTGEPVEFPIDDGLSIADRNGIRKVFDRYGVEGPEADLKGYALYLHASGTVRFRAGDLGRKEPALSSIPVEIVAQKLTEDVLGLVLEVARQGNQAFMSARGDRVLLTKEPSDPKIKRRWPDARVVETTAALRLWIENEIKGRKVLV